MSGRDADPILISLREAYVPSKQRDLKVSRRNVLSDSRPAAAPCSARPGASTSAASTHTAAPSGSLAGAGVRVAVGSPRCRPGLLRVPEPFAACVRGSRPLPGRVGEGLRLLDPSAHLPCPCRRLGSWRR